VAGVFFLYVLFPEKAVKTYLGARLTTMDPTLTMSVDAISPAIPPGLKIKGMALNRGGTLLARVDQARLSAVLSSLFNDQKRFLFEARLADGNVDGQIFMEGSGPYARLRMEADLSGIRLERLDALQSMSRFSLSGTVKGHLTHDGGRAPRGEANGLLTATGLHITLKKPFFGIAELMMDQTDADFSVNGKTLRLKSLTFDGPMMEGRINGSIELENPFERSRLNLSGNVKPRPELFARLQETVPQGLVNPRTLGTRGLNFRVFGSADDPDVSMR
jgi:type II secretion system protein N